MADHESPGPTQPEARGGDRLPPSTLPDQRGSGVAFFERLEALETAVGRVGGILTEQLPRRLARESGAQRSQLSELARELGAAFRRLLRDVEALRSGLPGEVSGAEARLSAAVNRVLHEVEGRLAEYRQAVGTRVEESTGALADRLEQSDATLRAALDELAGGIQADLHALRALPTRLVEGMSAVREAVGGIADAHGHIEERLDDVSRATSGQEVRARVDEATQALAARLGEAAGNLRWEVQDALNRVHEQLASLTGGVEGVRTDAQERASALQTGLQRVDNLAEAVESIGRRRGFRQVVESDERLRQEQAAMVERLTDAGERLAARLDDVKQELEGLRKAAHDAQAGLLAEEIRRRVADELVTEEMVQEVLKRMQQSFERSFAEMAAQVDARLRAAIEPSRRGLFRRAREQA